MSFDLVAFYITAHQDDWELFRGQQAYSDLQTNNAKIVFIYTTAGDAGETDGWWEAREQGAIAAVQFAISSEPLTMDVVNINNHAILKYSCANSVMYCLRLPDGNINGNGYNSTSHTSLAKLRDSNIPISAVDGSTMYETWDDFCSTIAQIVEFESIDIPEEHPWINAPDYSPSKNPGDHADHKATADAVRTFAADKKYNRAWWLTYCTEHFPSNLNGGDLTHKHDIFYAYATKVQQVTTQQGHPVPPNDHEWQVWGDKNYFRLVMWDSEDLDNPVPSSAPDLPHLERTHLVNMQKVAVIHSKAALMHGTRKRSFNNR